MAARGHRRVIGLAAALALGCAAPGQYTWVDDLALAPQAAEAEYVIGVGDVVSVRIFGQDAMSADARVRGDGRITLPLIGDQEAAGLTPATLAELLGAHFKALVNQPLVTVALVERRDPRVAVLGAVVTSGVYALRPDAGVLDALAQAGGVTPQAKLDRVFVIRDGTDGALPFRVRFRYQGLLAAEPRAAGFRLRDGDVVYVDQR